MRRWLTRGTLVGLVFGLLYLWAFPYFARMKSANELPRIFVTEEIIEARTLRIDRRLPELGSQFDVASTPDGHKYSNKAPGVSFMLVPVYAAVHAVVGRPSLGFTTWLFRVVGATLPALFLLWILRRPLALLAGGGASGVAEGRLIDSPGVRAALVALGCGSMLLPYGVLFMSHALAAAASGTAFALAIVLVRGEPRRPDLYAIGVGLAAGVAVLADYQAAIAAVGVGLYALLGTRPRVRLSAALAIGLGALPPAILLGVYHQVAFGSPFRTGYSFAADPAHQQGVLGIVGPNRQAMWNALLAPDNGLLVLTPWVLLAIVGAVMIARDPERRRAVGAEALTCGGIAVAYLLFVGSLVPEFGRAGWSIGPRYVVAAVPFLALLAAPALAAAARRPWTWAGALALVGVGVIVHVVAATTYPHWPTAFRNPLYEVSFRALHEGFAPHSLATAIGLRGWPSLLPAWAAAAGLLAWASGATSRQARREQVALGAAIVLATVVVALYHRFPASDPADMPRRWAYVLSTWEPR